MFKLQQIVDLQRETNGLLRELIVLLAQRPPLTRPAADPSRKPRIYTDRDVGYANPEKAEREREARERNVPEHANSSSSVGPTMSPTPRS